MMTEEPEISETPEVIRKAQAIMRSLEPEMPCSGWPCLEIQKACLRIAELEIEKERKKMSLPSEN